MSLIQQKLDVHKTDTDVTLSNVTDIQDSLNNAIPAKYKDTAKGEISVCIAENDLL